MGIFTDGFKELKKADQPLYKTPKSIQETIDIKKISMDGIFELGNNKFSKSYRFSDINYSTTNEDEQEDIFERYCRFLNSMECCVKITKNNKNRDQEKLRETVLIKEKPDGFNEDRDAYNEVIEDKIRVGRQGTQQERYITVTIERKNIDEAAIQFATIENTIHKAFGELGADIVPLDANERIRILHDFYCLGREDGFAFDIKNAAKVGADFRNDLVGGMIKYFPDHIEDDGEWVRALFIKRYPSSLSDSFLNEITSMPIHSITSIDILPIPKDLTTRTLQNKYLGIESDIIKQQRVRNRNNDFSSDISYSKRMEKKDIETIMDDVRENDQRLFYVSVIILVVGRDKKELDSVTETIETIGKRHSVTIDTHYLKQREAMNTALPIGVRQVETMRTMLTQSVAVLLPFNVQEMNDSGGIYYGINQVSKNINVGNRKKLINGNGFIFGVPGGGKSFCAKEEMGQVFLNTDDDIIVIDPMGEYFDIARHYHGTVVNLSAYTKNYVNPLQADLVHINEKGLRDVISDKAEFMLSVCDQLLGSSMNQKHHSIIDRCIRELYMRAYRTKLIPLMSDFYNLLKEQNEIEAKELALSLELFVEGSLNIFNHYTNVDVDNRFTVYGIQDLGPQLAPIAMLVMMEAIQSRIIGNGKKGKATWLYIDECHVLLGSDYSAKYLQQLWKKVRKQGGLCTGISQNVTDLLQNYVAATLISNSEFIVLLKQSNIDSRKLSEAIGVSDAQLRYVSNSPAGTGLIKCGNKEDLIMEKNKDLQHYSKSTERASEESSRKSADQRKRNKNGSYIDNSGSDYEDSVQRGKEYRKRKKARETKSGNKNGEATAKGRYSTKSRMIANYISNLNKEEQQTDLIHAAKETAKREAILVIRKIIATVLPASAGAVSLIALVAGIVIMLLAVIYQSPFAIFFPKIDTGYDDIRMVLSSYYMDFNKQVISIEKNGDTLTYQNTENGTPVSNYRDTLMVYMILYGDGKTAYVMDEEGKKNLKKVFDEMNYINSESSATPMEVGDSIGEVWVTAYCSCSLCCGPYANGITASGKKASAKHTVAVDAYHPIVPMGTKVVIEGTVYTVEDTGDLNHYGNDFDIYFSDHNLATQFGRRHVEAYIAEGNTNTVTVISSGSTVHNLTYKDYINKGTMNEDQTKLLTELMGSDLWNQYYGDSVGEEVAQMALTKVGCGYSQDRRYDEGWYDCSSLVYRLYKEVGIILPEVASTQGKYCFENAMIINKEELRPGDLIFYSTEENGEFRNITHVAIYVGDEMMVHASNPTRGVVLDPLRTNNVVFYARPYT